MESQTLESKLPITIFSYVEEGISHTITYRGIDYRLAFYELFIEIYHKLNSNGGNNGRMCIKK